MKSKFRRTARHGVPEVWIVDLQNRCFLFHRSPIAGEYTNQTSAERRAEEDTSESTVPGLAVAGRRLTHFVRFLAFAAVFAAPRFCKHGLTISPGVTTMMSSVSAVPAADSAAAQEHFAACLAFETDCWDVHESMSGGRPDFVLLDVRSPALYAKGHVASAISVPHATITEQTMSAYPADTLFVVYCAGPHCNGAHRGALRLAKLGRPVKMMIGGITGWLDEGFDLVRG